MAVLAKKLLIFAAINLAVLIILLRIGDIIINRFQYEIGNTESLLLSMTSGARYDFALLGTSHARIFSRENMHLETERLTGKKFFNLAKGGGGLIAQKIALTEFYRRGNRADKIIYMLDPWIFYSDRWNEQNYFPNDEPFQVGYLLELFQNRVGYGVIANYLKSKVEPAWFFTAPRHSSFMNGVLTRAEPADAKKALEKFYPLGTDGFDAKIFAKYAMLLKDMANLAKTNGSQIILVIPPTLLGDLPGEDRLVSLLADYRDRDAATYFDLSGVAGDPYLYYNTDHLNTDGARCFSRYFLRPIVEGADPKVIMKRALDNRDQCQELRTLSTAVLES